MGLRMSKRIAGRLKGFHKDCRIGGLEGLGSQCPFCPYRPTKSIFPLEGAQQMTPLQGLDPGELRVRWVATHRLQMTPLQGFFSGELRVRWVATHRLQMTPLQGLDPGELRVRRVATHRLQIAPLQGLAPGELRVRWVAIHRLQMTAMSQNQISCYFEQLFGSSKEYSLDYELLFACPETTFVRIVSFGTAPTI